jgi:shikimate dehydrogenase
MGHPAYFIATSRSKAAPRETTMQISINGTTRLYPIIGDPVIYARSPELLSKSFAERGLNAICVPMHVSEDALDHVMDGLQLIPNVDGLLTTMPHKFRAYGFCATHSEASRLLKVVSVIRRNLNGTWHGDSQDGASFVKAQVDQGAQPNGARVLLVGAGGAGSAIAISLLEAGVKELVVYDLNEDRVHGLIALLSGISQGRIKVGPPDPRGFDMVCNATHLGMMDEDPLPVAQELLKPSIFVGDVIAGHGETAFIRAARAAGCRTATGDQMVEAVQNMMVDFMLGL